MRWAVVVRGVALRHKSSMLLLLLKKKKNPTLNLKKKIPKQKKETNTALNIEQAPLYCWVLTATLCYQSCFSFSLTVSKHASWDHLKRPKSPDQKEREKKNLFDNLFPHKTQAIPSLGCVNSSTPSVREPHHSQILRRCYCYGRRCCCCCRCHLVQRRRDTERLFRTFEASN